MGVILITGGNKGLGRETARRLLALGHTVHIGARDAGRGRAAAEELGSGFVQLDVTDDASVAAAAAELTRGEGRLDVLINNAGVFEGVVGPEELTAGQAEAVYAVNVFGVVRVTHAFLPLLRAADSPAIVNVSSGLGSFGVVNDPARSEGAHAVPLYASSKAAVGMLTVQYAKGLPDIRVNAVDPGFTATDLNANSGPQSLEEGTDAIVRMATAAGGPTGTFSDRSGPLPW
ncbi:SDR family NAD(P)-dependent oxidoreductase [Streptomyces sp. NBC_01476]|uniref:SDR family NAD(P)-dependent oxidoreductase n=1 Tax=Streptomyces sp. NBC_01476 TaxID=2903881 RepID=UPI002E379B63|nr:SDR family NAD(P)-dependent oxidoreductase [Streptomyces sp. NBC_01476]